MIRYPPILRDEVSKETMEHFKLRDASVTSTQIEGERGASDWDDPFSMPSVNLVGFVTVNERLLLDQPMNITVNDTAFIGFPTSLRAADNNTSTSGAGVNAPNNDGDNVPLLLGSFNIVFAVRLRQLPSCQLDMVRRCARELSLACKREEERCGYLTEQCRAMFGVRENWLRAQQQQHGEKPDHAQLAEGLLNSSSLAREMRDVFVGLRDSGMAHVKLGGWMSLSCSLTPVTQYPSYPIRPYQTLLITDPSLVPADASSDLLRFVSACKPSKSFQDMQMELNLPLSQIFRMAAHILYWKIGRIVSTMTTANVYCINPDVQVTQALCKQFESDFPSLSLLQQLARFSAAKPVREHLTEITVSHKQFSDVLVWMLRRELVLQLFTYLILIVPESFECDGMTPSWETFQDGGLEDAEPEFPASKVKLSPFEEAYVKAVASEDTPLDRLFVRLCAYSRGRHHIDEIVWRENITHQDVSTVLREPKYAALVQILTV